LGYYYYWGFRDYDRGLEEFEIAERGLPNDPRILEAVAYIWRRQNRFADAAEKLQVALQLNPQADGIAYDISITLIWMHDYREAMHYIDRAISHLHTAGRSGSGSPVVFGCAPVGKVVDNLGVVGDAREKL